ncbi:MAG: type II toxin-antitoxin system mRNA interferase toxin, RelE/StbE family [Armatimonadetes bacterium CG_4_10_14_3_um_filter_66_18]|nr:type II toxin-antitoxin system YafQ family toxin [Armatimonadota bacterium]OIP12572.1 MAG: hypothetical protein AUJ96_00335 [Armatimonadetes bacterium CG2_30_66_41]PIU89289.1 MAG: type II toxin-antitoxin system mRNA interferase toxin, RelE/StbE family [Armatimonadetes bacterium CG06_land_8_20_14_3_00_66_21]PIX46468.1 MAG: type II toxin-antitoxin system mRNA interferase toxin, RelE/StbE family [Armatimonadetes bacterium CG_4_8_14_3_um_filter_66_20]PIY36123.1 MAG: type II toxin-antitoxin syste
MRSIRRTSQFKMDVRRLTKRGCDFAEFRQTIESLATGQPLSVRHRDHPLRGGHAGTRECHVEPDWLLVYELSVDEVILIRTGTHADLFE